MKAFWRQHGVATIIALLIAVAFATGPPFWWRHLPWSAATSPTTIACPSFSMISVKPDSSDRLRPPTGLAVTWAPSQTLIGHVTATLHWTNSDSRTAFGLIEITGRYGNVNPLDEAITTDGQSLPATGLCGHWFRKYTLPDDGERGVVFEGLWPNERYCFSVNESDAGGGVHAPYPWIGNPAVCGTAPWQASWGKAAVP